MVKAKAKENQTAKEASEEAREASAEKKMKALDMALEHIEKQFGKG